MADSALEAGLGAVLNMVVSLAAEEITLAWGVKEELEKLADKRQMIQALLSDARSKQITDKGVQLWLERLESVALDAQIALDDFGYKVLCQKVECRKRDTVRRFFSCLNPVVHRPKIAHKIKDVMSSIENLLHESNVLGLRGVINSTPHLKEKRPTEHPFVDVSEIVGRDDDTSTVINMLVGSDYQRELPFIAILGMGGQGKTTLAKLVYNNREVQSYFDKRVWVGVSDDFDTERLLAEMCQSLTRTNRQLTNVEALVSDLQKELRDKRYLLVLDDVWDEQAREWDRNHMRECLQAIGGSKGSKVLITTRSEEVAKTMQRSKFHRLEVLPDNQSWELFEKLAFADGGAKKSPEMVNIGQRILVRCGGVPLAIKVLGRLLYSNNCQSDWLRIERSELWNDSGRGNKVLSAIKLSYDHLPSSELKQCFAYCAIFKKDTPMKKHELIQLWMAQGLLSPPKGSQMEDTGSDYFNSLLRSSLLEEVENDYYDDGIDDDDDITYYKMHDLVHDVSLKVSENYCFHVKDGKDVLDEIKAVHLSIIASEEGLSKSLKDIVPSQLRTLHLEGCYVLEDLFENFKYVTVLILKHENITELPNSISKMRHLRYFDTSSCGEISRLPESFPQLYYLQTLKVFHLREVPEGFGKLINLRHVYLGWRYEFSVPDCLIPGLSQLKNLQTLPFYKVDKCNGCQIEELEHLDNLKGVLRIYCLENVSTRKSALKANLSKKSEVQTLYLHWDPDAGREEDCDDSDVMEGLKPHSNLKSLTIHGYQSLKFPSWITARNDLKLLVKLTLRDLNKCEQLPSLGHLPCLEHLNLHVLEKLRCIGEEFYGGSNVEWVKKSNCSNGSQITLFPSLKVFELRFLENLVEWSDAHAHSSSVEVFPVLEEMTLEYLDELCSFPDLGCLPKLRRLKINRCDRLTLLPSNWNGFGSLGKSEIEDERAASTHDSYVVSSSVGPSSSSSCPPHHDDDLVVNVPNVRYLPSLSEVSIEDCDMFAAPFCSLKILAPLESLTIRCNPSLWPNDLHHLSNLRSLTLGGKGNWSEEDCFPFPYSIPIVTGAPEDVQYFPSLTALTLEGYGFASLSDQIQYLTSLRDLTINYFHELEALPDWLGNLRSLQNLTVGGCTGLKQLPSAESFQRLTNLQRLQFHPVCFNIQDACTQGSGLEWLKIALIPNLEVRFG